VDRHEQGFTIFLKLGTLVGRGCIFDGQFVEFEAILKGLEILFIRILQVKENKSFRIIQNVSDVFKIVDGTDVG
jgi:hypothetical protein